MENVEKKTVSPPGGARTVKVGRVQTMVVYWKKVQDKGLGAPCREKPLEKSGLKPVAPNRLADRNGSVLPTRLQCCRSEWLGQREFARKSWARIKFTCAGTARKIIVYWLQCCRYHVCVHDVVFFFFFAALNLDATTHVFQTFLTVSSSFR